MTSPRAVSVFAGFRFPPEVISLAVRWYITSWNHAAEVLFGVRAEQAIGQALGLLLVPEALRLHAGCFRAAMSSGHLAHGGQPALVEAVTPGGERMPLALTLGLLAGPDGAPGGAVAVLRCADTSLVPFGATELRDRQDNGYSEGE